MDFIILSTSFCPGEHSRTTPHHRHNSSSLGIGINGYSWDVGAEVAVEEKTCFHVENVSFFAEEEEVGDF